MKTRILLTILTLLPFLGFAQNDALFTHFMYHTNLYNPATAGNSDGITVGLLARQQWVGFDEAPSTQLLNAYAYVPKLKGGVGLTVVNDVLGKQRTTSVRLGYAYRQRVGDRMYISAGLNFGIANNYVKGSELRYQQTGDQSQYTVGDGQVKPDIGLGLEFAGKGLTVGLSFSHLQQSIGNSTVWKTPRHYYAYAKYNWNVTDKWQLTPAVFFRSAGFISQVDLNLNATWNKRVVVGASYRTTDDMAALLGVYIVKNVLASYSFDFDFGALRTNNSGSHELTIIANFPAFKEKVHVMKSPRYF
ncbi:type IX secretion system membrane protein PorP/SprF [soil metagenome]